MSVKIERCIVADWESGAICLNYDTIFYFRIPIDLVRELAQLGFDLKRYRKNMVIVANLVRERNHVEIDAQVLRDALSLLPVVPENEAFRSRLLGLLEPAVQSEYEVGVFYSLKFPVVKGGGVSSKLPNFPSQLRRNLR